ncbi:sensor histidine kinase [Candidatus Laterigemmans baculatus]|uniref:sensor histidine kinase n=1 Tax=Candidatus Laterigemmans baculatus TaxID=2770505 RepID=UPI001F2B4DB3|nr:HAMP domain-containing sensor histidine kinase [Candidatus Laterigemmans baculatus]
MFEHRSLKWPITLGVVMIVLVILMTVGWVLLTVIGAIGNEDDAPAYWVLLSAGSVSLACILAGVIVYLIQLVQATNMNRRQSNFVDSVTHELKSPIASLKLYLQTLSRRQVNDEQRENFHRYMLADVERLDQLINHLLDAARVKRPDPEELRETCRVDELLEQCRASIQARYELGDEVITLDAEPIELSANPVDLTIAFRNLLDNAIKYGGSPPEVAVTARLCDGAAWVSVADNGAGIPRKLRRKIFGRFVRLGNELERSRQGTGLGLYLVRTVVRSLGGSVRVRDGRNRSGTIFELHLPNANTVK